MANTLLQGNFDKKKKGKASEYLLKVFPDGCPPGHRTQMWACPDDIDYSSVNPRRSENPNYEDIQASILQGGDLKTPLAISLNPETGRLEIYSGGNTRLKIVKAAWTNGDERFAEVRCDYQPWESLLQSMANHFTENTARGKMTLIDKALAVWKIKEALEKKCGEAISQRVLLEELSCRGVSVHRKTLQAYLLAAKFHAHCPLALDAGAGSPFVEGLSKLENALEHIFNFGLGGESVATSSDLSEVLYKSLKDLDKSDGLTVSDVTEYLVQNLVEPLEMEVWEVQVLLDAAKARDDLSRFLPVSSDNEPETQEGEGLNPVSSSERSEEQTDLFGSGDGSESSGDDGLYGSDTSDYPVSSGTGFDSPNQNEQGNSVVPAGMAAMTEAIAGIDDPMAGGSDDVPMGGLLSWKDAKQMLLTMGQQEHNRVLVQAADVLAEADTVAALDAIIGAAVAKKHALQGGE